MFSLLITQLTSAKYSSIPAQYKSVVKKAVQDSNTRTASSTFEEVMYPGHYQIGGISFDLTLPLISRHVPEVKGFAKEGDIIAIIKSRSSLSKGVFHTKTAFADAQEQKIYSLDSVVAEEDDLSLFNSSDMNPLLVFGNLLLKTYRDLDAGIDCSLNETATAGAQCKAWFGYNWPSASEGEDPTTFKANYLRNDPVPGIKVRAGAYAQVFGAASVQFQGLFDMEAHMSIDFDAVAGLGVYVVDDIINADIDIAEFTYPIYGFHTNILGIKISLGLEAFIGFSLRNISLIVPELEYYRDIKFKFHKAGSLSTSNGYQGDPFTYSITSDQSSNLENTTIEDIIYNTRLHVEPTIDAGARCNIIVGSVINTSLAIGVDFAIGMEFGMSPYMCTFPYLYGTTDFALGAYIGSPGLSIFSLQIIPKWKLRWEIYRSKRTPPLCLFSSKVSKEGCTDYQSTKRIPSSVIFPERAYLPADYPKPVNFEPNVYLYAYEDGFLETSYRALQLQYFNIPAGKSGKENGVDLQRILVLNNPLASTVMAYMNQYNDSYDLTYPFPISDERDIEVCQPKELCITTKIRPSSEVEALKEFNTSLRYISSEINGKDGDVYGLIMHGENESYRAPLSGNKVFDDAAIMPSKGEYHYKTLLNITVRKFRIRHHEDVDTSGGSLWFYRVQDGVPTPLGHVRFQGGRANSVNFAEDLGIDSFYVPWEVTDENVTLRVDISMWLDEHSKIASMTVPADQLQESNPDECFYSQTPDGSFVHVCRVKTQPMALFETEKTAGTDEIARGIISKVFQGEKGLTKLTFHMDENEMYGIARFFIEGDIEKIGDNAFILLECPVIVPLCEYTIIDKSHLLIKLVHNVTLFSTAEQTFYYDNVFSINIPFRRQDSKAGDHTVELKSVFISGANGMCDRVDSINGTIYPSVPAGCLDTLQAPDAIYSGLLYEGDIGIASDVLNIDDNFVIREWLYKDTNAHDVKILIRDTNTTIGESTLSVFLPSARAKDYRLGSQSVLVQCDKCSRVRAENGNATSYLSKTGQLYEFTVKKDEDVMFIAECDNPDSSFCEFTEDFTTDGLVLLSLGDSGVIDTNYADNGTKLLSGVSRQLVHGRGAARLIKQWPGRIERIATNLAKGSINIVRTKNETHTNITATFGGVEIPISINSFRSRTVEFLMAIGIDVPLEGLENGDLYVTRDGSIQVSHHLFYDNIENTVKDSISSSRTALEDGFTVFDLFDIPRSMVTDVTLDGQSFKEPESTPGNDVDNDNNNQDNQGGNTPKKDNTNLIIIIASVVGAVVVIAIIIVVVIFVHKSKKNVEVSHTESSSESLRI